MGQAQPGCSKHTPMGAGREEPRARHSPGACSLSLPTLIVLAQGLHPAPRKRISWAGPSGATSCPVPTGPGGQIILQSPRILGTPWVAVQMERGGQQQRGPWMPPRAELPAPAPALAQLPGESGESTADPRAHHRGPLDPLPSPGRGACRAGSSPLAHSQDSPTVCSFPSELKPKPTLNLIIEL